MRVAVVHLSDIHLRPKNNPVIAKSDQIIAAISSVDASVSLFLIVISGDIAFSGSVDEYLVAQEFFDQIQQGLKGRNSTADVRLVCIPGNHDCSLPENERTLRELLIGGLLPSLRESAQDAAVLARVLEVQRAYQAFHARFNQATNGAWDGICQTTFIEHGGKTIQVNLYNTAILSRREEKQGELQLPIAVVRSRVTLARNAALCISAFHHSYLWLESNQAMEFRNHIETTCDVALTGHQHYPHAFYKQNSTGERVLYLEADALQDSDYPHKSAFRILVFDLHTEQERSFDFRWSAHEGLYRPVQTSEWRTLTINRTIRAEFTPNQNFEDFINDVGSPLWHKRKGQIRLREIFVFPDLTVRSHKRSSVREVKGEELIKYAVSSERVLFQAPAFGGKTSLAKVLFAELLATAEIVPLMLSGPKIISTNQARIEVQLWSEFENAYSTSILESFRQLDKSKRALIIDDWHKTHLNPDGRQKFLEIAGQYFHRIFLFADDFFQLQELIEKSTVTTLEYDHATLEQFHHALRGRIIDKWVTLGQEHTGDGGVLAREIEDKENLVRGLIGRNVLPSLPFVILCILQAEQEGKAQSAEAGAFGYLYEVLVTTALNATKGPKAQLEKKYVFLARLAYHMFKMDIESISSDNVKAIAEEYSRSHLVKVDINSILTDLEESRILLRIDGNYSFAYRHLFYYFVARFYKDNLDRPGGDALRNELSHMADYISSDEYSAVLMFVIYFARDSSGIITKIVTNSKAIYKGELPSNLDSDVTFLNTFCELPDREFPEEVDLEANRKERREVRDRIERSGQRMLARDTRKFSYSEDLSDKDKFDLAHQHIDLLGQVIRNFPGSLPGADKVEILESCYLLGLRMMRALLKLLESSTTIYRDALLKVRKELEEETVEKIRKEVDSLLIVIARICVLSVIKRISGSVGVADLEDAYRETLARVGRMNSTELINLAIKLDHFAGFPDTYIRELHKQFAGNAFTDTLLSDLVMAHMLMFDVSRKTRQSMSALFKLKHNTPMLMDPTRKR